MANKLYTFNIPNDIKNIKGKKNQTDIDKSKIFSYDGLQKKIKHRIKNVKSALHHFKTSALKAVSLGRMQLIKSDEKSVQQQVIIRENSTRNQNTLISQLKAPSGDLAPSQEGLNSMEEQFKLGNNPLLNVQIDIKQNPMLNIQMENVHDEMENNVKNSDKGENQDEKKHNHSRRSQMVPIPKGFKGLSTVIKNDQLEHPELYYRKPFLDQMFSDILGLQTQIKMMFKFLLYKLFCKKFCFKGDINVQLIEQAVSMIKTDMDILVIADRMQEIDKLKKLFLSENQIKLFNYTPKPVIRAEQESQKKGKISFKAETHHMTVSQIRYKERKGEKIADHIKSLKKSQSMFDKKSKFNSKDQFFNLFKAYNTLLDELQSERKTKNYRRLNRRLMDLLGHQMVEIFETSMLLEDNGDII